MKHKRLAAVVLAAALWLTGCGGAAAPAAPAGAQREDYTYNKQHSNKFFHFVYLRNMSLRRGEMYNYLVVHALHYALVRVYNTTKSLTLQ